MTEPHPLDLPTAADLRARGSLKWTAVPSDIAAWVAESDLGTAPAVTAALHAAVDAGVFGYLPPAVRADMARACAQWHSARYGWEVPVGRVHPVPDVLDALKTVIEHFSRPGSPVIVPTPAYMPFLTAPRAWGRRVIQVPMQTAPGPTGPGDDPAPDVMGLDLPALEAAFTAGGHLLVLTNPHNPTGRVMRREELLALAEVVERHGGRVFADEIHAPLTLDGAQHVPYASVSSAAAGHTVTATSASKAWNLPGLKCAQIVLSNDADVERWRPLDHLATHGASTLGAIANTAAYSSGGQWLDGMLPYLQGNSRALGDVLAEHAPHVGYTRPQGTYLAWLDLRCALPSPSDPAAAAEAVRDLVARSGVALVDGTACGEAGRGFVRLNLAMPRPLVVEAGRRLAACLDR
ncbi:MalY/PatB family protein [Actinotalea sp. K2]|uniref:MalY/PatB family protein n=1 Tax=Actinotalea sp. K2 TaxID=2939438 RepID=UPI002017A854|nr:aminotransferase class I/II-fold pyridoxal phosphate-dependent enzyme [Actinotalea sp. K2]MCL3860404.1 aminotransferase class I/II-fold pyridoxal phosphate-dependent enzyme [Actinotalea sp. K2]